MKKQTTNRPTLREGLQDNHFTFTESNNDDYIDIDDKDGRVCSINMLAMEEMDVTREQARAKAKLICDAVNNYQSLVDALNRIVKDCLNDNVHDAELRDTILTFGQTALNNTK